ncbi:hypothetical protein M3N55_13810, partial [Roseibaca sp. V10]
KCPGMVCRPQPFRHNVRGSLQCVTVSETRMGQTRYTKFMTLPALVNFLFIPYIAGSILIWIVYPYTLSRADFFRTSPFSYWSGRLISAITGLGLVAFIIVMMLPE